MSFNEKIFFNNFCLRLKLKRLETKRADEITKFIANNPSLAAKADNIESKLNSEIIKNIDFKIKAIQRLLDQTSKN